MLNFDKNNWYWQLADGRIWSTKAAAFVPDDGAAINAGVQEWLRAQGLASIPESPKDESGNCSEEGLREALIFYGLPLGELLTLEEQRAATQKAFTDAIQARLDEFAQTRNYDGILSAATYATSTVPQFQVEGQYAAEARDATWTIGYGILNAVLAGERPMPTLEEVFEELPVLEWPETAA